MLWSMVIGEDVFWVRTYPTPKYAFFSCRANKQTLFENPFFFPFFGGGGEGALRLSDDCESCDLECFSEPVPLGGLFGRFFFVCQLCLSLTLVLPTQGWDGICSCGLLGWAG